MVEDGDCFSNVVLCNFLALLSNSMTFKLCERPALSSNTTAGFVTSHKDATRV